ncbi:hypothetical protein EVAR_81093_1 [Eumeta japonica]|uniref:Uncharacterized protein n=1 Tax=Eumeta variegata TaxID=151549 RepID=A0A4C1T5Y8_EUMVA|nr:hypothetical protein EVAR_81093_1 [Eumeta japonica]
MRIKVFPLSTRLIPPSPSTKLMEISHSNGRRVGNPIPAAWRYTRARRSTRASIGLPAPQNLVHNLLSTELIQYTFGSDTVPMSMFL